VRNFVSFMLFLVAVLVMSLATQFYRGHTVPLLGCMLAAVLLFVCGLIIHKRGVKR
jgi:hypothetical protein